MAELADFLGLERSTMSGLVDRAEQRGRLRRAKSTDDARAVGVLVAPADLALAARSHAEVRRALSPDHRPPRRRGAPHADRLLARMLGSAQDRAAARP